MCPPLSRTSWTNFPISHRSNAASMNSGRRWRSLPSTPTRGARPMSRVSIRSSRQLIADHHAHERIEREIVDAQTFSRDRARPIRICANWPSAELPELERRRDELDAGRAARDDSAGPDGFAEYGDGNPRRHGRRRSQPLRGGALPPVLAICGRARLENPADEQQHFRARRITRKSFS